MSKPKSSRRAIAAPATGRANHCPLDGVTLDEAGYCWQGGGYPQLRWWWDDTDRSKAQWKTITATCPFSCPLCRHDLGWDGACMACYGSATPRDKRTWTFTGDSYVLQRGHWVREHGPCRASTPEQVRAGSAIVKLVMEGALSAAEGILRLKADGVIT